VVAIFAGMKKLTFYLLAVSVLTASCKRTQGKLTEEEVLKVINRFDDGWRNKNLPEVDAALAPPYVYFTQSGGTFSRDSVVQTAGSPLYSLDTMSRTSFIVDWSQCVSSSYGL
jgi:hypothetical protein